MRIPHKKSTTAENSDITKVAYRADIDGLRAVAIVSVVLYHFGWGPVVGGYLGVDIFFVISGYLITSLVCAELASGTFSLASFYERRVRRIFPALAFALIVTSLLALVILLPRDLSLFAKSLVATTTLLSNVEFFREAGYFDVTAAQKPLLHTWSLAVEEQFYLFFPPLLLATARFLKRRYLSAIIPLLVVSLSLAACGESRYQAATFYLLPTRMWELALGALLAQVPRPNLVMPPVANGLCMIGFALIGLSIANFTPATSFPSAALPASLGTALIIFAGANAPTLPLANRILTWTPLVFTGRISYSLYLWHWPLLVFAQYDLARDLTATEKVELLCVVVAVSVCSWRYIEQPFRGRRGALKRASLFVGAAGVTATLMSVGIIAYASAGLPQRFGPETQRLLSATEEYSAERRHCVALSAKALAAGQFCRIGKPAAEPSFVLWGDSHAEAIAAGVSLAAARHAKAGWLAATDGCAPLLGVRRIDDNGGDACALFNESVYQFIRTRNVRTVVLSARWSLLAESRRYKMEPGGAAFIADAQSDEELEVANKEVLARGITRTVEALQGDGRRVIVIAGIPEVGVSVPETLVRHRFTGRSEDIGPTVKEYEERQRFVLALLTSLHGSHGLEVIYPAEILCDVARCMVSKDDHPLYSDDNHLSLYGAITLSGLFDRLFSAGV